MIDINRFYCFGKKSPPLKWKCENPTGINRLYHIHYGTGGFYHKGKAYTFESGKLYYIPFDSDFYPYCSDSDPIIHTYADFEMTLPFISQDILMISDSENEVVKTAVQVFDECGRITVEKNIAPEAINRDPLLFELCRASVAGLVTYIAEKNNVHQINDDIISAALKKIHSELESDITVAEIAKESYMSVDGFIRRFTKVVGCTPYTYIKTLRIRTAMLMRQQGVDLGEIAKQVGYSDTSALLHAIRNFTKKSSGHR